MQFFFKCPFQSLLLLMASVVLGYWWELGYYLSHRYISRSRTDPCHVDIFPRRDMDVDVSQYVFSGRQEEARIEFGELGKQFLRWIMKIWDEEEKQGVN